MIPEGNGCGKQYNTMTRLSGPYKLPDKKKIGASPPAFRQRVHHVSGRKSFGRPHAVEQGLRPDGNYLHPLIRGGDISPVWFSSQQMIYHIGTTACGLCMCQFPTDSGESFNPGSSRYPA